MFVLSQIRRGCSEKIILACRAYRLLTRIGVERLSHIIVMASKLPLEFPNQIYTCSNYHPGDWINVRLQSIISLGSDGIINIMPSVLKIMSDEASTMVQMFLFTIA
jgi:hypothetical protein